MTDLPVCRWREHRVDGTLACHSEKYIAAPNRVSPDFCRSCRYRDHDGPGASPEVMRLDDLLPVHGMAFSDGGRPTDLPPMFCITCRQTPERTAKAAAHFRERGLDVHFFPGVHGRTFGLRTVLQAWPGYRMPAGHVGLVLSHYMLWQTLTFLPFDEAMILEDDAWFVPDFPEHFRQARMELPADWQFVFVGSVGTEGKPVRAVSPRVSVMRYPVGTHAYLVKRSVLPFLLRTNHQARSHIDLQLIANSLPALNCYTFTPSLVKQRSVCDLLDGTDERWPSTSTVADADDGPPVRTYNDIEGWFGFADVYDLALARASGGQTFVEVGTWKGKSTAYMAMRIQQSGRPLRFFTIDTFQGSLDETHQQQQILHLQGGRQTLYDQFSDNLKGCGLRQYVTPIISDSATAAERFPDRSVDFCFLDGCHSYEAVSRDIRAWLPKVRPGGLLGGDDFAWAGVAQAVREAFGSRFRLSQQEYKSWLVDVE